MKYRTDHLSLHQKKAICRLAHPKCTNWWADMLDCSKSVRREEIDVSFDEIMEKLDEDAYFTIIHRNSSHENHLEIGFRTGGLGPDYFLWMILDPEHIDDFTTKLDCDPY